VSISGSPVVVDGKPRGIIGMFADITERKKMKSNSKKVFKKLTKDYGKIVSMLFQ